MKTNNPIAPAANTYTLGHARFQLLTQRLVRMEWAADNAFEDRPTFAVVNRACPAVACRAEVRGRTLTLRTAGLTLVYRDDGKPFHAGNLSATFTMQGRTVRWRAGQEDTGNLGSTLRTLDSVDGDQQTHWVDNPDYAEGAEGQKGWKRIPQGTPVNLGRGLLSRSGWSLFDDSTGIVLGQQQGRAWPQARPAGERRDWYLLAYGHDFKSALRDAARVFGRQPLPPRYAFGYWWCRYWAYTDQEFEQLQQAFNTMNVPLDVMVVDMDWHLEGWTGYTWDRRFFPNPREFLQRMKDDQLAVTLNLHPADGVGRHEEAFAPMARAMGLDPRKAERVPFDCTDPKFVDAYFKFLHHPHEKMGVDFWWMDWQQGYETKIPGLDPLPWLNQLHWEDMEQNPRRAGKRPLIFSRFGGLGAGRYCIGFSGDTYSNWKSLRFQPHFTATAANVLYGYWSHDIGGHQPGPIEPELYLRWIQYGVFSPILRTHTSKNPDAERRIWQYPDPFDHLMMDAVRLRYELVPYLYTECRKGVDSGLSLCRPLYHEWPEEKAAYAAKDQYLFGDHLLVAPVVSPADRDTELASVDVWLPAGTWFDTARGEVVAGGRTLKRRYLWNEIPVFVRPGAILPGQRDARRLRQPSITDLVVTVYGGNAGAYTLHEDDGLSADYESQSAAITLSHRRRGAVHQISIAPVKKAYPGFAWKKSLEIRLPATTPPASVKVGARALRWTHRPGVEGWSYDGATATTIIRVRSVDLKRGVRVNVTGSRFGGAVDGLRGALSRLQRVMYYSRLAMSYHILHPQERLGVDLAQTGNRLSREPGRFTDEMKTYRRHLAALPRMLKELAQRGRDNKPEAHRQERCRKALALLADVSG
jgi:alpha-glucosidase (family GH31 glycosyl hydrolase)